MIIERYIELRGNYYLVIAAFTENHILQQITILFLAGNSMHLATVKNYPAQF
jgi:hypothetical protein